MIWCDVASACYRGQVDQVKETINKITIFPETEQYGHVFVVDVNVISPMKGEKLII